MPDSAKNNRKKKGMISMAMKSGEYEKMAQKASPPTKKLKNGISAFGIGGLICTLGEGLSILYEHLGISEEDTKLLVSASLILLAAILIVFVINIIKLIKCGTKQRELGVTLFAGVTGFVLCGMTDCLFYGLKPLQYFMMILGLSQAVFAVYLKKKN